MTIRISSITVNKGRRAVDQDKVKELAESIQEIGLLNPVTVTSNYALIAGAHRLAAVKLLGKTEIEANVIDISGLKAKLAEIDENLIRNDLHYTERGDLLLERKNIYEGLHPETKREATLKQNRSEIISERSIPSFVKDTAQKTGVSERTVEHDIQVAKNLAPEVKETIRKHDIPKTDALKLARMEPEKQRAVADKIAAGEAKNVKEADRKVKQETKEKSLIERGEAKPITGKLYEGDLFEQLRNIPDHSIDLVFADPPYMVLEEEWDQFKDKDEFIRFTERWLYAVESKVKKTGRIYVSFSSLYMFELSKILGSGIFKHRFNFGSVIIWNYRNNNKPFDRKRYRIAYEPIFYIYGKSAPELNFTEETFGEMQTNVWTIATPQSNFSEGKYHPAQKPVELLERIIMTGSKEGDTVLDPFAGSGTTGVAAQSLKRNYILIEKDKEYCKIIKGRLNA